MPPADVFADALAPPPLMPNSDMPPACQPPEPLRASASARADAAAADSRLRLRRQRRHARRAEDAARPPPPR